jgi:hypothetical protein
MPYTVKYKGVEIECSSKEEAVELAVMLSGDESSRGKSHSAGSDNLEISRYREFVGYLNSNQKRFLTMLVENPHGKTDRSIRQDLGLNDNMALGGVLSGLGKFAKNLGINVDSIWTSTKKKVGDDKVKEFRITPEFKKIANDVGLL